MRLTIFIASISNLVKTSSPKSFCKVSIVYHQLEVQKRKPSRNKEYQTLARIRMISEGPNFSSLVSFRSHLSILQISTIASIKALLKSKAQQYLLLRMTSMKRLSQISYLRMLTIHSHTLATQRCSKNKRLRRMLT
jgi:hypothetical protein